MLGDRSLEASDVGRRSRVQSPDVGEEPQDRNPGDAIGSDQERAAGHLLDLGAADGPERRSALLGVARVLLRRSAPREQEKRQDEELAGDTGHGTSRPRSAARNFR